MKHLLLIIISSRYKKERKALLKLLLGLLLSLTFLGIVLASII